MHGCFTGLDEEFMESTNERIRDVFAGKNPDPNYGRNVVLEMLQKVGHATSSLLPRHYVTDETWCWRCCKTWG